jgi:DNA-binding response OmpR family regulator
VSFPAEKAKTILLVDDDAHILETAQDILEASGYAVQTAESGAAALEKLKAGPFHLMIVDFNLLDTTGIDLALKAREIRPQMQVILMSGETEIDLGPARSVIRSILVKPVNPAELLTLIKQTIC